MSRNACSWVHIVLGEKNFFQNWVNYWFHNISLLVEQNQTSYDGFRIFFKVGFSLTFQPISHQSYHLWTILWKYYLGPGQAVLSPDSWLFLISITVSDPEWTLNIYLHILSEWWVKYSKSVFECFFGSEVSEDRGKWWNRKLEGRRLCPSWGCIALI